LLSGRALPNCYTRFEVPWIPIDMGMTVLGDVMIRVEQWPQIKLNVTPL